jgi:SAM-dependent methyltransferase
MKCLLCDSDKAEMLLKDTREILPFSIFSCDSCTNAWTNPPPNIIDYQSADFHASTIDLLDDVEAIRKIDDLPKEWKQSIMMQVSLLKQTLPPRSKILEIGCGEGLLLNELSKANFQAKGIEPSIAGSRRARSRGLDVITGHFPISLMHENFDAIVLSHVLEHFEDPIKVLTEIADRLPSGYLLLIQSNYKGLIPKLIAEEWYAWTPEQHYWHFTPYGLGLIASKTGFETVDCEFSSLVHWGRSRKIMQKVARIYPPFQDQFHLLLKRKTKM